MKKIFYKIFFKILLCSYIPLIAVFIFQYWYAVSYMHSVETENLLSRINQVKRISSNEAIIGIVEVTKSKMILDLILQFYKGYSFFAIPIILILAYSLSKKFSNPIEKELKEMNEKLKHELEQKIVVMRAISHELKTPIAIINGYIEALQDGMVAPEDLEKTYRIIYDEGVAMDKLIQDINTYIKSTDYSNLKLAREKIDIKNEIEQNLERYELDIRQKDIKVKCDLEKTEIYIDRKCLNSIITNILTNALTYVDERKEIEISLKDGEFMVANSSCELGKDMMKKIFNPFYKGDSSRERKYGGTGVGLSIIKNLLEFLKLEYSFTFDKKRKFAVFRVKFHKKGLTLK